jgi:hypothetical protein
LKLRKKRGEEDGESEDGEDSRMKWKTEPEKPSLIAIVPLSG